MLCFLLFRGRVLIWYSKSYAPADGHARDVNSMQRFLLFRARVGRDFWDRFYVMFSTITVTGGSLVLCFVLFDGRDFLDCFYFMP